MVFHYNFPTSVCRKMSPPHTEDMELLPCAVLSVAFIACTSVCRDEFISAVIMSGIYWR